MHVIMHFLWASGIESSTGSFHVEFWVENVHVKTFCASWQPMKIKHVKCSL